MALAVPLREVGNLGANTHWDASFTNPEVDPWPLAYHATYPYTQEAKERGVHESGGAGLISTGKDYLRFLTAVLASLTGRALPLDGNNNSDGGGSGGSGGSDSGSGEALAVRGRLAPHLLSRTVAEMLARDSLGPSLPRPSWVQGFGLGLAVTLDPAGQDRVCSPNTLYWAGIFGTNYFLSPRDMVAAVLLTQRYPDLPPGNLRDKYQGMVLQALAPKPPESFPRTGSHRNHQRSVFRNASSLPMMSAAVPQDSAGPDRMQRLQVTLMVPNLLGEGANLSLKFVGTAAGFRPVIVADADDNVLYVQARVLPDLVVASCQRRGSPVKTAAEPERVAGRVPYGLPPQAWAGLLKRTSHPTATDVDGPEWQEYRQKNTLT